MAMLSSHQMFSRAKRGLQTIQSQSKNASDQERRLAKNVVQSLAGSLQELSTNFRKTQSSYLKSESHKFIVVGQCIIMLVGVGGGGGGVVCYDVCLVGA